ncbi:MAG: hypothetical protein ABSC94_09970 [Polyangiaceae bacterium]|jgi:hypothetical protein
MSPLQRAALFLVALFAAGPTSCKRSGHARVSSFLRPTLPAGFIERTGRGFRIAVPATWTASGQGRAAWVYDDPQAVDDYRANVSVVTEAYVGESYDYAKAAEDSARHDARAAVGATREDVIDGDPTLVLEARWSMGSPVVTFRSMQADLASRGIGYVVTCSASPAAFERYRSTCEAIVHSFAVER